MEADFCVAVLEDAIARYGKPELFNTDQGSQFTSFAFTNTLRGAGIRISMDGRGRWMDNVFIERLWRSLKYECVECCFGTSPIQAEKLRPDRKTFGSATQATRAAASIGPMPGIGLSVSLPKR